MGRAKLVTFHKSTNSPSSHQKGHQKAPRRSVFVSRCSGLPAALRPQWLVPTHATVFTGDLYLPSYFTLVQAKSG